MNKFEMQELLANALERIEILYNNTASMISYRRICIRIAKKNATIEVMDALCKYDEILCVKKNAHAIAQKLVELILDINDPLQSYKLYHILFE